MIVGISFAARDFGLPNDIDFNPEAKGFRQANFTNLIDHFTQGDQRTYQQRFWYSTEGFDKKHGPIFVYIWGEYECGVQEDRLFPYKISREHHGLYFFVEHRYYGTSQPFNDLSTENLRYLTSRHALADLALFLTEVNNKLISEFGGHKRKVIVIGGSYPGALSAWFREKYPHIADASWASSAVVNAIEDFNMFDYQIYNSTRRTNLYWTGTIQNMTIVYDRVVSQGNREWVNQIKGYFNATHLDDRDFAFYFADMFVLSIQYGGRTNLCKFLESLAGKDMMKHYQLTAEYVKNVGSPNDYNREGLKNTTIVPSNPGRQWTYQYCTEFGWFQVPYDRVMMRSELLKHEFWTDYWKSIFGEKIQLRIHETNAEFGGDKVTTPNIYFVNGGEDPWQWAGMLESKPKLNIHSDILQCTNCAHCVELYNEKPTDSEDLKSTRRNIKKWVERVLEHNPHDINQVIN